jgi:hypothetical protein
MLSCKVSLLLLTCRRCDDISTALASMRRKGISAASLPSISRHVLPPVCLGSGATRLADKLSALLHSLRLEVGSETAMQNYLESVTCFCTDMGTESGLSEVSHISMEGVAKDAAAALDTTLKSEARALPDEAAHALRAGDGWDQQLRDNVEEVNRLFPNAIYCAGFSNKLAMEAEDTKHDQTSNTNT